MLSDFALEMAVQKEGWVPWLAKLSFKAGLQVGLNLASPGSGSFVDFYGAYCDFRKGNMKGGLVNVSFGLLSILTVGVSNVFKGAAKASFETATKGMKIGLEQGVPSIIFEKVISESSKISLKIAPHNLLMSIFSSGGRDVNEAMIQSTFEMGFTKVFEMLKTKTKNAIICVTMQGTKEAAEREAKKYGLKNLFLNYVCAFAKGWIKKNDSESSYDR